MHRSPADEPVGSPTRPPAAIDPFRAPAGVVAPTSEAGVPRAYTEDAAVALGERLFRRTLVAALAGALIGALLVLGLLVAWPTLYDRARDAVTGGPVPAAVPDR